MEKTNIEVLEPVRLFWGDLPWTFAFEIALRSVAMFVFLLLVLRISGKRSLTQMSPFEFSLLIALGSSAGDPMFYDDVPLLHGMIVIVVVVFILKFLEKITQDSKKLEVVLEGEPICLVKDGIVVKSELKKEEISADELFMKLREKGIRNLSVVERAYLEVSGNVSVFCFQDEQTKIGLDIMPLEKDDIRFEAGHYVNGYFSCYKCGYTENFDSKLENCKNCNSNIWLQSKKEKTKSTN